MSKNNNYLIPFSFQAQDTPVNSMFSFQIGVIAPEQEETTSAESAALPENVKVKLQEILQLLNQDISQLVQDAEPIRAILKSLKGQLPEPIEEALIPAAFIEVTKYKSLEHKRDLPIGFSKSKPPRGGMTSKVSWTLLE